MIFLPPNLIKAWELPDANVFKFEGTIFVVHPSGYVDVLDYSAKQNLSEIERRMPVGVREACRLWVENTLEMPVWRYLNLVLGTTKE